MALESAPRLRGSLERRRVTAPAGGSKHLQTPQTQSTVELLTNVCYQEYHPNRAGRANDAGDAVVSVSLGLVQTSERARVRNTVILCGHCLRNIAFYRAGWRRKRARVRRQFWIGANGAFIDVAILEWCKLFTDTRGGHRWTRTVADRAGFIAGLLARLRMTQAEFDAYSRTLKHPRDKFIAHLDDYPTMYLPWLRPARASAAFLRDYLLNDAATTHWFQPWEKTSARDFYKEMYEHALEEYQAAESAR
jgi:hypothetical protein